MKDTIEDFTTSEELALRVPANDLAEFYKLCSRNQERVRKMLEIFAVIEAAPNRGAGFAQGVALGEGEKGFTFKSLEANFGLFRKTRDWRVAVNWSWESGNSSGQPDEFVSYLQEQVDKRQRKVEQALKQLRDAWRKGASIPGYGTWRQWWQKMHPGLAIPDYCPGFPEGWHKRNLRRYLDTSKFRRVAQTIGRTAAKSHRSRVYTSRKDLWLMSHVMFDDVEHDFMTNSLREWQAGRSLELFSHDYYPSRKVRYGVRTKTVKADGTTNKLTGQMMRMVVAATFYLDGYSPRGTTICAEHGTAAVPEWMEELLFTITGGLITTTRAGFNGAAAHAGQYPGIRRGNPNFKASLESSNNLTHNVLDHLPAQTGHRLSTRPEGLHAMLDHNADLLAAMQQMPLEVAGRLQLDLLTENELMEVLSYYYSYIENDTEHELEGWEECNHIVQELEIAGRWLTQTDLLALRDKSPEQHAMALALLEAGHIKTRPRKMSRREVWDRDSGSLIKIPPYGVCEILGEDLSAERKVGKGMFEFEDAEVGPGVHRYDCIVETLEGYRMELREGEIFQAFVNPFAPDQLFVRDAKGRYIGVAGRIAKPSRGDIKAVHAAMGAAAAREAELLAPLRKRQEDEIKRREARARHNTALLSGEPTTPEEKERARELNRMARKGGESALEGMLDEPEATANPELTPEETTIEDLL